MYIFSLLHLKNIIKVGDICGSFTHVLLYIVKVYIVCLITDINF